jgi:hypothetical protein
MYFLAAWIHHLMSIARSRFKTAHMPGASFVSPAIGTGCPERI